jgi:hypothetical protein
MDDYKELLNALDETSSNEKKKIVFDCGDMYTQFSKCMSIKTQIEYIHRNGDINDCSLSFRDWRTCLYGKLVTNEDKLEVSVLVV